ncbi:hypothetical protein BGZ83_007225 [Gryganskiella cystojenkinii]|nr:hypothetical protein BGZ83_007225 [Gryganskiella cystojenkinii]
MYSYFTHPAASSSRRQHYHHKHQHQPVYFQPSYAATSAISDDEDLIDEEEQLLLAALERKRQQKQARQQYLLEQEHLQQLAVQRRQQQLINQERALQQQRRLANARAVQAQYEAEQEAIRQYKKQHEEQRNQVILEHLFLQHLQEQQERAVAAQHAQAKARAEAIQRQKIQQQQQQRQRQLALEEAARQSKAVETEKKDVHDDEEEILAALLNAIFFPQNQVNRQVCTQSQGENACNRRQLCLEQKQKEAAAAAAEHAKKEREAKESKLKEQEQLAKKATSKSSTESDHEDLIGNYFQTFPEIKAMVEAALGAEIESSSSPRCCRSTGYAAPACASKNFTKANTPSSTHSSPELRATDILRQRQQRQNEQKLSLHEKHSELNLIESTLDDLSRELNNIVASEEHEQAKKQVLHNEENVTRAMVKIDAVMSEGDLSVRARRKELIKKSQALLDLVDEFKNREGTDGKKAVLNAGPVSEAEVLAAVGATSTTGIEPTAVVVESSAEVEDFDAPSDIESLPDTTTTAPTDNDAVVEAEPIDEEDDDESVVPYNVQDTPVTVAENAATVNQDEVEADVVESESEDQVSVPESVPAPSSATAASLPVEYQSKDDENAAHEVAKSDSDDFELVASH